MNKHLVEIYNLLTDDRRPSVSRFGSDEQLMGAIIMLIADLKEKAKPAKKPDIFDECGT